MLTPSIALPTGPYDWRESDAPRALYEERLARLRDLMRERGLTHVVVQGDTFDHEALARFSHFTPKLGPALMLASLDGAPRILFSGGPGMKPSAARLTWIADVAALRGLEKEVAAWLAPAPTARVGLICGASILQGDFDAIRRGAGGELVELDAALAATIDPAEALAAVRSSARVLQCVADHLFEHGGTGADLRALALGAERFAYAQGAQDVRLRISRSPRGAPVTLPDSPAALATPASVALAVRCRGQWACADFILGDNAAAALDAAVEFRAYANRVAFPEPPHAATGLLQAFATADGRRVSAPCFLDGTRREWLFRPPGA